MTEQLRRGDAGIPPADIQFRPLRAGEEGEACALVKAVFEQHLAADFSPQGRQEFFRYAQAEAMAARRGPQQLCLVADSGGQLVGVLELRGGAHLALLFVSQPRRGIARELLRRAVAACRAQHPDLRVLTVNSSLYARGVYERLGFQACGLACTVNGIDHVPMALDLAAAP